MSRARGIQALSPWEEFALDPAAYVAASRVALCFEGMLPPEICGQLVTSLRLRERLNALIVATYQLTPVGPAEACTETDRAIALSAADRLAEIARRSGAIFWSAAISSVILASQVKTLRAQLGEDLYRFAQANHDLAGPPRSIEPLIEAGALVARDGWHCLGAWCHAQREAVGARVRLKLMPDEALDSEPQPPFAALGPDIVRRAAG